MEKQVNNPYLEPAFSRYLHGKAARNGIPLAGNFELTPCCNLRCKMCYVRKTPEEVRAMGGLRSTEDWIRLGEEAVEKGMLFLLITGGEPMTHPGFFEIYKTLHRKGVMISVNTNGTLVDEKALEFFKENTPFRINITLYGTSAETYEALCGDGDAYNRATRAITELCKAGISVKVNISGTPSNGDDVTEIYDFAEKTGAKSQATFYMFPGIRRGRTFESGDRFSPEEAAQKQVEYDLHRFGKDEFMKRAALLKAGHVMEDPERECMELPSEHIRCRAGSSAFWVTWDFKMSPCGMMTRPQVSLAEKDFETCWQETRENTRKIMIPAKCTACENRNNCIVCPSVCLAENDDFEKAPDYMCGMTEAYIRLTLDKAAELENEKRE